MAPRRDAGPQAARLRRLRGGRRMADRRGLDHARPSWRSRAAATAGCSSAPPSPSGPSCTPPPCARPRCSTWSATSASASARPGTTSTAPPPTPTELGWLLSYSPYHHVVGRHGLPGGALHRLRRRHPGRPAPRPQDVRRPAVGDRARSGIEPDPAAAGGEGGPRRPLGHPHGRRWPPTSSASLADQLGLALGLTGSGGENSPTAATGSHVSTLGPPCPGP